MPGTEGSSSSSSGQPRPEAAPELEPNQEPASEEHLDPEEDAVPQAEDGSNPLPVSLRLRKRLSREVELYKLHVKHYHMSSLQFKKRKSQLALPDEICEKYDKVCKQCKICSSAVKAPPRSHASGMRSENFRDLVFVDHCFIPIDNGPF